MRIAPSVPRDVADALKSMWGPLERYAHPTRIDLGSRRIGTATDAVGDEDLVTLRQVKRLVADVRSDAADATPPIGALSQEIVRGHLVPDITDARDIGTTIKRWRDAWFNRIVRADQVGLSDTNDSHHLLLTAGSNLTADRALTFTTGDLARTVTLSGNPTLADWFDQAVKTTSAPTFGTDTVVRTDADALTYVRVRNDTDGAAAYTACVLNASGNSWGMRMGSTTANSNTWELVLDAFGAPAIKMSVTTAGNATIAGALTIGSGSVSLVGSDGRINGPLSSTILDDLSGANLTALSASNVASGTLDAARLPTSAVQSTNNKVTAGAPYVNDGYVICTINGNSVKVMTTA